MEAINRLSNTVMLCLLCLPLSAFADEPEIQIMDHGVFKPPSSMQGTQNPLASGQTDVRAKPTPIQTTTKTIPCKLGTYWGAKIAYLNVPQQDYVLRIEIHHPEIKQPDGTTMTLSVIETPIPGGSTPPKPTIGWAFLPGYEYELVAGNWTWKIMIDGKELQTITFKVEGCPMLMRLQ